MSRHALLALVAVLGSTWTGPALADGSAADRALAQALFDEGRALLQAGKTTEACIKLEKSEALDASGGTMLNLALCHEQQGKTASAWTEYHDALAMARKDGRDERQEFAQKHIATLDAILSRLTVKVPVDGLPEGIEILRNGAVVPRAAWNAAAPVDPGPQAIVVRAPGYESWSTTVVVGPKGDAEVVEIPPLRRLAVVPTPGDPSAITPSPASAQRTVGFVLVGVGALAAAVGVGFGIHALSADGSAHTLCGSDATCSSASGLSANQDAVTSAKAADGLLFGGLALAGGGLVIALTARAPSSPAASAGLVLSPRRLGFTLPF